MLGKSIVAALVVALALSFTGMAKAEEGPGPDAKAERKRPPHPILFILDHAKELGITDEQKAKLEELREKVLKHLDGAKPEGKPEKPSEEARKALREQFEKILTAEQIEKLKEMMKQFRPERGPRPERKDK